MDRDVDRDVGEYAGLDRDVDEDVAKDVDGGGADATDGDHSLSYSGFFLQPYDGDDLDSFR